MRDRERKRERQREMCREINGVRQRYKRERERERERERDRKSEKDRERLLTVSLTSDHFRHRKCSASSPRPVQDSVVTIEKTNTINCRFSIICYIIFYRFFPVIG